MAELASASDSEGEGEEDAAEEVQPHLSIVVIGAECQIRQSSLLLFTKVGMNLHTIPQNVPRAYPLQLKLLCLHCELCKAKGTALATCTSTLMLRRANLPGCTMLMESGCNCSTAASEALTCQMYLLVGTYRGLCVFAKQPVTELLTEAAHLVWSNMSRAIMLLEAAQHRLPVPDHLLTRIACVGCVVVQAAAVSSEEEESGDELEAISDDEEEDALMDLDADEASSSGDEQLEEEDCDLPKGGSQPKKQKTESQSQGLGSVGWDASDEEEEPVAPAAQGRLCSHYAVAHNVFKTGTGSQVHA